MYQTCPKCGHDRGPHETGPADVCPACGLIFSKYLRARVAPLAAPAASAGIAPAAPVEPGFTERVRGLALHVPDEVEPTYVYLRGILLAGLIIYGVKLAAMDIPSWEMASSLIHAPMVPIHEFGHLLFWPFGEFMHNLGGSLFQAGLPLIFGGIFLVRNRDPFAAAVMLWWCAVAVMDIAPYMYDAQMPQHVLLTGRTGDTGAHDFIDVLGDLGLLHRAQAVGRVTHAFGVAMLVTALAWAAYLVWMQFQRRR